MQAAVVNRSASLSDPDVAFACKAVNAQALECARAWDVAPVPVVPYSTADGLPPVECRIVVIVDDLNHPGALGYHTDVLGAVYARVQAQGDDTWITLSHEVLEMLIDPTIAEWRPVGLSSRSVALEVCDPVEADVYGVTAEIAGAVKTVQVSNYVLPAWFDPAAVGPFDRMQKLDAPFTMTEGGYMLVRDGDGPTFDIFARTRPGDVEARHRLAGKMMRRGSRTLRRLRG